MNKDIDKKKLIVIISIILIISGIGFLIKYNNEKTKRNKDPESFYEWDIDLAHKFSDYVEEIYPTSEKYLANEDDTLSISLKEVRDKYGKDISMFNTRKVSCDIENSIVKIEYDSGNEVRVIGLKCIQK